MTFVLITVFLDMVGFGLIMPVLPGLIEQVGGMTSPMPPSSAVGCSSPFPSRSLPSPADGKPERPVGRRPLLLLAVFGLVVDYLFSAFAPSIFWLFVGRAIAGFCGSSYVIANAYIADVTAPEDRAKAFGMMGAAFGVGFVLGPAIGGLLGEFGPRVPFFVAAGISALNLVYGWFVLPETLPPEKRRAFEWRRANPFGTLAVFRQLCGCAAAVRGAVCVFLCLVRLSGDLALLGDGEVRLVAWRWSGCRWRPSASSRRSFRVG